MCKILTVRYDRKTGNVLEQKLRDSNETIDYAAVADAVIDSYLRSIRKEDKPCRL